MVCSSWSGKNYKTTNKLSGVGKNENKVFIINRLRCCKRDGTQCRTKIRRFESRNVGSKLQLRFVAYRNIGRSCIFCMVEYSRQCCFVWNNCTWWDGLFPTACIMVIFKVWKGNSLIKHCNVRRPKKMIIRMNPVDSPKLRWIPHQVWINPLKGKPED